MTFKSVFTLGNVAVCSILALSACGQEQAPASVAIAPASAATATSSHTASHAQASGPNTATSASTITDKCHISIGSNDAMQFSTKQIVIPKDCQSITLTLAHNGKMPKTAMGHNLVITTSEHLKGVLSDGLKAGKEHDFVLPDDKRVLAQTKQLGGGESDTITVDVSAWDQSQTWVFVCTFPGHSGPMRGNLVFATS